MIKQPVPILHVVDLFPELLTKLLEVLSELDETEWGAPTVCAPWTVKQLAQHILGDDIGFLSGNRDGNRSGFIPTTNWEELVAAINKNNARWVAATDRISTRLLCDLLRSTGEQLCAHFKTMDPFKIGNPVNWAGPEPAPVWFDLAREYTERWHHQQQIREATKKPGLLEPRYLAPVLDTFIRALPYTFRNVVAREKSVIRIVLSGEAGGVWFLQCANREWVLLLAVDDEPEAGVTIPQEIAWKLFTKGITPENARKESLFTGDQPLA